MVVRHTVGTETLERIRGLLRECARPI